MVATGHTKVPFRPAFAGLQRFGGPVIHSSEYRNGQPYAHQSVLVIGFASFLSNHGLNNWLPKILQDS